MSCLSRRKNHRDKYRYKTNKARWREHLIVPGNKFYKIYRLIMKSKNYLSLGTANKTITSKWRMRVNSKWIEGAKWK